MSGQDFKLDTSGTVETLISFGAAHRHFMATWEKLSPFAQGYIEAAFASIPAVAHGGGFRARGYNEAGFRDLAPETLARIIADCERRLRHFPSHGETNPYFGVSPHKQLTDKGARFWADRQAGLCANFPPLTVQLGDDGKVRFADADGGGA